MGNITVKFRLCGYEYLDNKTIIMESKVKYALLINFIGENNDRKRKFKRANLTKRENVPMLLTK
jgi:hypothetical protein